MEIKILGWDVQGMWCPDVNLEFNPSDKVNFIQMNNGVGKTTTITLIKMALFGIDELGELKTSKSREDNKKALKQLVRTNCDTGVFNLRVSFDKAKYTFGFEVHKRGIAKKEIIKFYTSDTEHGMRDGHRPPTEAQRFLTPEFGLNYIYDAEEGVDLFKSDSPAAEKTINTLCQFNILDHADNLAQEYYENNVTKAGSKGSDGNTTRIKKKINAFKKAKKAKQKTLDFLRHKLKRDEIKYQEMKIVVTGKRSAIKGYKDKTALIEQRRKANDAGLKDRIREIYQTIINPAILSKTSLKSLNNFKKNLNVQNLPGVVAKEFFKEVSERDECICGRDITDHERNKILDNSINFMGEETSFIINSIKAQIPEDYNDIEFSLNSNLDELNSLDRESYQIVIDTDDLHLTADEGHDDQVQLANKMGALEVIISETSKEIDKFEEKINFSQVNKLPLPENVKSINTIDAIIKNLLTDLEEHTENRNLRKSYDVFSEIMRETKIQSSKIILEEIKNNLQNTIDLVINNENDPIIIKEISNYVELQDKAGDERGGLSEGQSVSLTYAFMSEVAKYTKIKTPFVVDTPTGPIDPSFRRMVGGFLPKFTEQFIAFVQAAEKRDFISYVRAAAEYKCSHVTISLNNEEHQTWLNDFKNSDDFREKDVIITDPHDALIVYGEVAFDSYDKPKEAEDTRNQ